MGLIINTSDLLSGEIVEWERVEFKKGWNPNPIMHTIVAFANDINNWGGGYILLGVEENEGRPIFPLVGLADANLDSIQKELLSLCYQIKPHYFSVVEPTKYEEKNILAIWAPGGQNRPYSCPVDFKANTKEHAFYLRRFSNTIRAKNEEQRELFALAGNVPFDDRINHNAALEDLKQNLIKEFLYEVKSDLYRDVADMPLDRLGQKMNIIDGHSESLMPKNIGLLMFNDYPQNFFPMSQIELVKFAGTTAGDIFNEKIFKGPIHLQIRDVLSYLERAVIEEKVIKVGEQAAARRILISPFPR